MRQNIAADITKAEQAGKMKAFFKSILTFCFLLLMASCSSSTPSPQVHQTQVMETAVSAAWTEAVQTQMVTIPTSTPANANQPVLKFMNMGTGYGSATYSSDGKWLYMSSNVGIYAYEAASNYQNVRLVASIPMGLLSPDEKYVATSSNLFSMDGSQKLPELILFSGADQTFHLNGEHTTFSPDGSLIARYYGGVGTAVWRVSDGILIDTFKGTLLQFSADSRFIAIQKSAPEAECSIYVYDVQTGEELGCWLGTRLIFLSDNRVVLEADGHTRIFDIRTHELQGGFAGTMAAFSQDEQNAATVLNDRVNIYRVSDGQLLQTLKGKFSRIDQAALQFSADGQTLFAYTRMSGCCSGSDAETALWRVADGTRITSLRACPSFIPSPDGETALVCGLVLNCSDGSLVASPEFGFTGSITNLAFASDGQQIIVASYESLYLYPVAGGPVWIPQLANPEIYEPLLQTLSPHTFYGLPDDMLSPEETYSPDQKTRVLKEGSKVTIWNTSGNARQFTFPGEVSRLVFSPDGLTLALGLKDSSVELWSVEHRRKIHTIPPRTNITHNPVGGLAFSPDGKLLAIGLEDGTVRLFGIDVK